MQRIVIYMTQAGKINFDLHGQSYGYADIPRFIDIPLLKVHFSADEVKIYTDKRGIVRLHKTALGTKAF